MIRSLRELVLLTRATNAALCARWCRWRYEKARDDLAKAIEAERASLIDLALLEVDEGRPIIPEFLLKAK